MRKNPELQEVEVDTIYIYCEDNGADFCGDSMWSEFDRLYCACNGQWIKTSAEDPAHWEFQVDESETELYNDAKEFIQRIDSTDFEELGYEYWYSEEVTEWDYDDFKAAFPNVNIDSLKEV